MNCQEKKFGSQQFKDQFTSFPLALSPFLTLSITHTQTHRACERHGLKTGPAIYQTSLKQDTIGMGIFTQQLVTFTISIAFNCKHKRADQSWKHGPLYPMTSFVFLQPTSLNNHSLLVTTPLKNNLSKQHTPPRRTGNFSDSV